MGYIKDQSDIDYHKELLDETNFKATLPDFPKKIKITKTTELRGGLECESECGFKFLIHNFEGKPLENKDYNAFIFHWFDSSGMSDDSYEYDEGELTLGLRLNDLFFNSITIL